jgi:signal transduction histidine kinase
MSIVFVNLLLNSIQAMDPQGKIAIRFYPSQDNIVIEFVDSGPGIATNILPKIFDPLFTTKQHGTGLGLATCKNIIEGHGGKIYVKNNPTTFTIVLPNGR